MININRPSYPSCLNFSIHSVPAGPGTKVQYYFSIKFDNKITKLPLPITMNVRLFSGLRLVNDFTSFWFSSKHFLADTFTLPLATEILKLGILSKPGKSSISPICKKK